MSSVLTNDMKTQGYFPTLDKNEAAKNPKAVYFKTGSNGIVSPEFTDDQKKAAFDYMKTTLRAKIDRKTSAQMYTEATPPRPAQWEQESAERKQKLINDGKTIGALYAARNGAELRMALTALRDINPNVLSVNRTPSGVSVRVKGPDDKVRDLPLNFRGSDNSLMTQEQFIIEAAPLLAGNGDWTTAVKRGGYIKGGKFNSQLSDAVDFKVESTATPPSIFGGGMNLPNPTGTPIPAAPTE
jgi:hypothetical protein